MKREHWPKRDDDDRSFQRTPLNGLLVEAVEAIDAMLPDRAFDEEIVREFARDDWSIGTEFEVLAPRKILRGFLVPIREVPTRVPVTMKVFAFLTINGSKDLLDRHLDQGIHYHYALSDKTHTTTMICWDTRWPGNTQIPVGARGLFHELHGLGAKSKSAKTWLWRDKKRASIREACEHDQGSRAITEFRCASNDAEPVWPQNSVLTPRPSQPPPHRAKAARK